MALGNKNYFLGGNESRLIWGNASKYLIQNILLYISRARFTTLEAGGIGYSRTAQTRNVE